MEALKETAKSLGVRVTKDVRDRRTGAITRVAKARAELARDVGIKRLIEIDKSYRQKLGKSVR